MKPSREALPMRKEKKYKHFHRNRSVDCLKHAALMTVNATLISINEKKIRHELNRTNLLVVTAVLSKCVIN